MTSTFTCYHCKRPGNTREGFYATFLPTRQYHWACWEILEKEGKL